MVEPLQARVKQLELPFDFTGAVIKMNDSVPVCIRPMPPNELTLRNIPSCCWNPLIEPNFNLQTNPPAHEAHGELARRGRDGDGAKGGVHGLAGQKPNTINPDLVK